MIEVKTQVSQVVVRVIDELTGLSVDVTLTGNALGTLAADNVKQATARWLKQAIEKLEK